MFAVVLVVLLVLAVALLSWHTRGRELPVRCCNPAPWPPDDISARGAACDEHR